MPWQNSPKRLRILTASCSSGHEVSWVLAPSFQGEQGSFRALRLCRHAAYPCITWSWVCAEDYTTKDGNASLLQGASYYMCKSRAFGQHTASWRTTQSSSSVSALQIMGVCCVLQGSGRTHFELKPWGTVSSKQLCTTCCTPHTKHPVWHACLGC